MRRPSRCFPVARPVAVPVILGLVAVVLAASLAQAAVPVSPAPRINPDAKAFKELAWRSVGPANMGGRVADFAVVQKRPATFYVALGTGGVFKTTNQGTTWSAVFEKQAVASVGAVAVWQKNPDVVWVGTGEANSRNSSSWGNGIYRSLDGGGTWDHLGLDATQTIARVVPDPTDSATVYVAALGHLWGENPERGVYVTRDGGKSWALSLKVDARTGACDLAMDPANPRVLYAAMYARRRTPWSYTSGGTTGGVFKTADGGRTWTKLSAGLPAETGRIGLDVYRKDPRVVYAVIESDEGGRVSTIDARSRTGGVFRSDDAGEHWTRLSPWAPRPFYFSQIRVQPDDDRRVYLLGVDLWISDDAGRTFRPGGGKNLHPDFHAMWIDPSDGDRVLTGSDGGIYLSHDRAATWDFINNLAIGEFYDLAVDMREPYRIYGGLQDNQTWGGPSATRVEPESWLDEPKHDGITNGDWYCLGGGDGFHVAVDPTDPDLVYYESQGGTLNRVNLASGKERVLRPAAREGTAEYRFNWNTPFALSPHDPSVLWMGGERLFRLYDHGDRWEEASPDLSTHDPAKMVTAGSGAETHCTIVTLAESPVRKGVLWVGTDDGKVWVSQDAGTHWTDLTTNLRVPAGLYMSCIEPSHHDAGTAYLAVDGHRSDIFRPWLFVTRDFGRTWSPITGDLPANGPVQVIREDPGSRDLLFAGTEFGLFMSLDAGGHWITLGDGLPTVAVDDILIHPRDRDLIAGTHGRSLFVLDDITPLEQWTADTGRAPVTLFAPRPATAFYARTSSGEWGQRRFSAKNPAFGATFTYYVKEWTGEGVSLAVADSAGKTVRKLTGPGAPGLHRVTWDLQREARERLRRSEWGDQSEFVPPGIYSVELTYGKTPKQKQSLVVRHAPGTADPAP